MQLQKASSSLVHFLIFFFYLKKKNIYIPFKKNVCVSVLYFIYYWDCDITCKHQFNKQAVYAE